MTIHDAPKTDEATRDDGYDLLFGVRRSIRYHLRRQRFFERWHAFTNAVSVVFSSAVLAVLIGELSDFWVILAAAVVTLFAVTDLVIGTSRMATLHNELARRFIFLEKKTHKARADDPATLTRLIDERLDIEADEPPPLRVLDCLCHNELLRAMDYAPDCGQYARVRWWQRLTAQFFDWNIDGINKAT